jgi:hypothetical protein
MTVGVDETGSGSRPIMGSGIFCVEPCTLLEVMQTEKNWNTLLLLRQPFSECKIENGVCVSFWLQNVDSWPELNWQCRVWGLLLIWQEYDCSFFPFCIGLQTRIWFHFAVYLKEIWSLSPCRTRLAAAAARGRSLQLYFSLLLHCYRVSSSGIRKSLTRRKSRVNSKYTVKNHLIGFKRA